MSFQDWNEIKWDKRGEKPKNESNKTFIPDLHCLHSLVIPSCYCKNLKNSTSVGTDPSPAPRIPIASLSIKVI